MDHISGNPDFEPSLSGPSNPPRGPSDPPRPETNASAKRSERALTPLVKGAKAGSAGAKPGLKAAVLAYATYAAVAAGLLGFGWAAGSHLFGAEGPFGPRTPARQSAESLERAELLRATRKIADDLHGLKADVDSVRAALALSQSAKEQHLQDQRALEKGLEGVKARVEAAKTETGAAISDLAGKLDRLQRDPVKLNEVVERLERVERQAAGATGSIGPAPAVGPTKAAAAPAEALSAKPLTAPEAAPKKPPLITSWVVRDVYNGTALVENARGALEVTVGENIPGAGAVKAIERRGRGWVVLTSRGYIDFARDNPMP